MASVRLLCIIVAVAGWTPILAEGDVLTETISATGLIRIPRTLHKKKLCKKYGICEGHGHGGYHQGYGGHENYGGHGGYQGGYGHQGPPINIAISQSQSSANEGGDSNGYGYYPNNYQYNGGHGYHQGYNGYNGYPGFHGFPNRGHGGYRPGFDNGNLAHNNQFNGNFYSGGGSHGGHGYNGHYGQESGEDGYDGYDGFDYDEGVRSASGGATARSSATASAQS